MRSSFIATTGLKLARSPSVRDQAVRRRRAVIGTFLGLAVASAVIGALTAPGHPREAQTGPFSYFPSE